MNTNRYHDLPREPEEAFLELESGFREECETAVRSSAQHDGDASVFWADYIAQVIAAVEELGLTDEFNQRVPTIAEVTYPVFINFCKDVKRYRTALEIRHARRFQAYSVYVGPVPKEKIQHHINQLREFFAKLDIDERKREALLGRLNDLQEELDRQRTRFDRFAALTVETAGVIGEAVDKSKVTQVLNAIARVLWGLKIEEETKQLPPPTKPKQIEPPRAPKPKQVRDFSADPDDEIPF